MNKKATLFAFVFALTCAVYTLGRQEQSKATISGTIRDASGAVVAGVEIYLKSEQCVCSKCPHACDCCPDQRTTSNDAGNFDLSVGHGIYTLRLSKSGFHAKEVRVDLTNDDTKSLSVTMTGGEVGH